MQARDEGEPFRTDVRLTSVIALKLVSRRPSRRHNAGMPTAVHTAMTVAVAAALVSGCTASTGHSNGATSQRGRAGSINGVVRVENAPPASAMTQRQAAVAMLNSDTPPPLAEAGTGIVRPVRFHFGSVTLAKTVAHSPRTRMSFAAAWVAEWDEPVQDLSLCPRPKRPADPAPAGPVHRLFVISANGDAATIYQGATINCGQVHPPFAAQAAQRLSVPWHADSRSPAGAVLSFSYPACGTPDGGQGRNGRWYVLVEVPLGQRCSGTAHGTQMYSGSRLPAAGRTGVVRSTNTDPLAPPVTA